MAMTDYFMNTVPLYCSTRDLQILLEKLLFSKSRFLWTFPLRKLVVVISFEIKLLSTKGYYRLLVSTA